MASNEAKIALSWAWTKAILFYVLLVAACLGDTPSGGGRLKETDVFVVAVAFEETDGYQRFTRSMQKYGLKYWVLGMGHKKNEENGTRYPGGGFKVSLLRQAMEEIKTQNNLLVLVMSGEHALVTGNSDAILDAFDKCKCRVLFASNDFCLIKDAEKKDAVDDEMQADGFCLSSAGGFAGFAPDVYRLLNERHQMDAEDEQTYYTAIYLDEQTQATMVTPFLNEASAYQKCELSATSDESAAASSLVVGPANATAVKVEVASLVGIKVDTRNELFQNLDGAMSQVKVEFQDTRSYLRNRITGTTPLVVHGSDPLVKSYFNSMANYLGDQWTPSGGCESCAEGKVVLSSVSREDYPVVFAALVMEKATPFLPAFFQRFELLDYPQSKIDLFVFNEVPYNLAATEAFVQRSKDKYRSVKYVTDTIGIRAAQNVAVAECRRTECEYFFMLDSEAQLTTPQTLSLLIGQNRSVIAPLLLRPGQLWSNFWGALSSDGYYARSDDYMDIVSYRRTGLWNVPYVANALMVQGRSLRRLPANPFDYGDNADDNRMSFCANARAQGVFMYIDNQHAYGHLINTDEFNSAQASPELFELFKNAIEWRGKYLHPNYSDVLELKPNELEQPCPDVYWFPIMSVAFCDELVNLMESFGQWSNGGTTDKRLRGGYESVPTRDIHMNQVAFETHWLHILEQFVRPVQLKAFTGYYSSSKAIMNFVVRYRPDEQPSLRPHHDTSTFTVNMALNTVNVNYEGGGVRFIRYNCSLVDLKKGWMLMHPGRLTHYHEGLPTTNGTRYVMISFVDP